MVGIFIILTEMAVAALKPDIQKSLDLLISFASGHKMDQGLFEFGLNVNGFALK